MTNSSERVTQDVILLLGFILRSNVPSPDKICLMLN